MKKFNIGLFVLAGACALVGLCVSLSSSSDNADDMASPVPVILNKVITNELSDTSSLKGMDSEVRRYMAQWNLRGVSLSVMRNDSLLYAKGYGWADTEAGEEMQPNMIMRVASVSKLLTATGIMVLKERGLLSLQDTVFGPRGILTDTSYTSVIRDPAYRKITVEDLLRHKGGFTSAGGDPMFSTRSIMLQNHLDTPPDRTTLLRTQLKRRLRFQPGTSQYYSNFGYLLLSLIVEEVSGEDYDTFMQENVLKPAGCHGMRIAGNYLEDRYPGEVKYYNGADTLLVEEYNNSGRLVDRCYGGNDIHSLSGAGAWVTSTPELARFVASIDGRPEVPDIISPESVAEMTRWIDENTYSLGWNDTKPDGEWTRTGTFSGTSALVKYYPDGECWVMVTNTSTWKGPGFTRYTAGLFRKLREKYSQALPSRNMFYEPVDK
ncbi:MAG: serine hydrolase domain-containing protein [Candidatus Cryptobacteroides sp.]|nr:beta-lactamase family protein [Bacteroidales bacterium]MDY3963421.1 serine hydrolase domain-containing protein [Candidatus Cryptobacteroides sp.]